jgi:hypothetical protein
MSNPPAGFNFITGFKEWKWFGMIRQIEINTRHFQVDLMKISVVFEGRLIARAFESDTEAKAGLCDGAACIAWMSQTVENRKFS